MKQIKRFFKKRKLRKRIRNYVSKNVPKSSKVYQIIRAPFLSKSVVFANGERIREVNKFRMIKKYPLRNSCKMLSLENNMVYKSLNHKMNNIASKFSGDIETNPGPLLWILPKPFMLHIVKEIVSFSVQMRENNVWQ